ncbi:MAG TPA: hypothetical protein VHZ78_08770 [Rhizomicrobium sp.]|nr:hypothetical protein [Rhizomicrobium sp.]
MSVPHDIAAPVAFAPLDLSVGDAAALDVRKFAIADIAKFFGLPPHLISAGPSWSRCWDLTEIAQHFVPSQPRAGSPAAVSESPLSESALLPGLSRRAKDAGGSE